MRINYDTQKLNSALRDFYTVTGVEIGILKPDFSTAFERGVHLVPYCNVVKSTGEGEYACFASDARLLQKCKESRKLETAVCHAGLLNVAVPLIYGEEIIGYIIFGCIKTADCTKAAAEFFDKQPAFQNELNKRYLELPILNNSQIESIANISIMLAKYILLENMLKPSFSDGVDKAVDYIKSNLCEELSIVKITKFTNTSKNLLYQGFRDLFGCTVGEYIKIKRVEHSIALMKSGNLSVEELSQQSGFASASYYSRVFKKHMSISPAKYQKMLQKQK